MQRINVDRMALYELLKAFTLGKDYVDFLLETKHMSSSPVAVLIEEFNENIKLMEKTGGSLHVIREKESE